NLGLRVGSAGFDFIPRGPNRGDVLVALSSNTTGTGQRLSLVNNSTGAVSDFITDFGLPTDVVQDPFGRLLVGDFSANAIYLLTPPLDADTNFDRKVDSRDLVMMAQHWLTSGTWAQGDFDRSGFIDSGDLAILARNWQVGVSGSLAQALTDVGLPT